MYVNVTDRVACLESFNGERFEALIDVEDDGTLTIVTEDRNGFGSAHLGYAYRFFDGAAERVLEHRYITSFGASRVFTCWVRTST